MGRKPPTVVSPSTTPTPPGPAGSGISSGSAEMVHFAGNQGFHFVSFIKFLLELDSLGRAHTVRSVSCMLRLSLSLSPPGLMNPYLSICPSAPQYI